MICRDAAPDDVPAILPMVRAVCALHEAWDAEKYGFRDDPGALYDAWLRARCGDPRSVLLLAERAARPVAFLVGAVEREIPIYRLREYGFIHDLWVEPDYRHEGVGRQLTMLAVERFAAMGVTQVRLDTAAVNDAARALFASCGFRPCATEMLLRLTP